MFVNIHAARAVLTDLVACCCKMRIINTPLRFGGHDLKAYAKMNFEQHVAFMLCEFMGGLT